MLISIGEEENAQEKLKKERLGFEVNLRKLLGISTKELDVESIGQKHEALIQIPRENSNELRKLDPLWEALQPKINILEERALLSPNFDSAKKEMKGEKIVLFSEIDNLLNSWNAQIAHKDNQEQTVVEILLIIDIGIFFLVLYVIRESLLPLRLITNALSGIKEGAYGEKIKYTKADEVGELVNTFNIMSDTIKEKEEETKKTEIAKDEFLAMITHELKTPLVPIQGYADILLSEHLGKLTDKQKERISIIKEISPKIKVAVTLDKKEGYDENSKLWNPEKGRNYWENADIIILEDYFSNPADLEKSIKIFKDAARGRKQVWVRVVTGSKRVNEKGIKSLEAEVEEYEKLIEVTRKYADGCMANDYNGTWLFSSKSYDKSERLDTTKRLYKKFRGIKFNKEREQGSM